MTHPLIIRYNPMTVSDLKLTHILWTLSPLYSCMSRQHQMALEAAYIVVFDAPEDVGLFFVLTRKDRLYSFDPNEKDITILESSTTSVHDSLAIAVCNEFLSSPDSFQKKVLTKSLSSLAFAHNNFVHIMEVKVLAELLLPSVKEKSCVR